MVQGCGFQVGDVCMRVMDSLVQDERLWQCRVLVYMHGREGKGCEKLVGMQVG